jgi:hypothetical protein
MKWLKNKIIKWVREDWEEERKKNGEKGILVSSRDVESSPENDPIITFRIYSATNGKILEFRRYDRKTDRNDNSTYIVEKDRDIGEYVSKCLSLEMLK